MPTGKQRVGRWSPPGSSALAPVSVVVGVLASLPILFIIMLAGVAMPPTSPQ
jgi:hypothetical protein